MRRSERTRASSSGWLIGFVRKSSAPTSMPLTRSVAGSSAVTMTTGRSRVASSARSRRQTSYPLISGITTSRSTRSGCSARTSSRATAPDGAVITA
jgi:hypothetical protein